MDTVRTVQNLFWKKMKSVFKMCSGRKCNCWTANFSVLDVLYNDVRKTFYKDYIAKCFTHKNQQKQRSINC